MKSDPRSRPPRSPPKSTYRKSKAYLSHKPNTSISSSPLRVSPYTTISSRGISSVLEDIRPLWIPVLPPSFYRRVFELCSFDDKSFATTISHVCSHWRTIALCSPSLWTDITIEFRGLSFLRIEMEKLRVMNWIVRSRNKPVRVNIKAVIRIQWKDVEYIRGIIRIVWPRCESLKICCGSSRMFENIICDLPLTVSPLRIIHFECTRRHLPHLSNIGFFAPEVRTLVWDSDVRPAPSVFKRLEELTMSLSSHAFNNGSHLRDFCSPFTHIHVFHIVLNLENAPSFQFHQIFDFEIVFPRLVELHVESDSRMALKGILGTISATTLRSLSVTASTSITSHRYLEPHITRSLILEVYRMIMSATGSGIQFLKLVNTEADSAIILRCLECARQLKVLILDEKQVTDALVNGLLSPTVTILATYAQLLCPRLNSVTLNARITGAMLLKLILIRSRWYYGARGRVGGKAERGFYTEDMMEADAARSRDEWFSFPIRELRYGDQAIVSPNEARQINGLLDMLRSEYASMALMK